MSTPENDALTRLADVRQDLATCATAASRDPDQVTLVAVSKRHPLSRILELAAAGQRDFGENYVDEALAKMADAGREAPDLAAAITWHFIGRIQSNKTRALAEHFDWVHSVDRAKIADRLSAQRPPELGPLNCLIEVNVSGEASKGGVAPEDTPALARHIAALPNLRLRGLMALPAPESDRERQEAAFAVVRELANRINLALSAAGGAEASAPAPMDVLSMGTSGDYRAAIAAGATHVRIGTAVFGARPA